MKSKQKTEMNSYLITYYAGAKTETIKIEALGFSHIADVLQQSVGFVPDVTNVQKINILPA